MRYTKRLVVCLVKILELRLFRGGCRLADFSAACRDARNEKLVSLRPFLGGLGPKSLLDRPLAGFTLVELMVALFVSAILATVVVRLFSVTSQTGREELARSSAEGATLIFMRLVERDLQGTTPAGISLAVAGDALVTHPMGEALSTGQIAYLNLTVFWNHDSANEVLKRREYENLFSPFTEPQRLDEAGILALDSNSTGKVSRVLDGVTSFRVQNPPDVVPPQIGSPLTVEIEKKVEGAATRPTVKFVRTVYVRTGAN